MRLIDADALSTKVIFVCEDGYYGADMVLKKDIDNAPTIEAEPVKHGRWIPAYGDKWVKCSECECHWQSGIIEHCNVNYCPNCGAKMQGGAENE